MNSDEYVIGLENEVAGLYGQVMELANKLAAAQSRIWKLTGCAPTCADYEEKQNFYTLQIALAKERQAGRDEMRAMLAAAEARIMQLESAQMDAYDAESHKSYLEGKQAGRDECQKELSDIEVAINTVVYCYDKRPENFALALNELKQLADSIRPQPPKESDNAP